MTTDDCLEIWEKVKANHKRLAHCSRPHELERTQSDRWRCRKCGGEIELVAGMYYQEGLADGAVIK